MMSGPMRMRVLVAKGSQISMMERYPLSMMERYPPSSGHAVCRLAPTVHRKHHRVYRTDPRLAFGTAKLVRVIPAPSGVRTNRVSPLFRSTVTVFTSRTTKSNISFTSHALKNSEKKCTMILYVFRRYVKRTFPAVQPERHRRPHL